MSGVLEVRISARSWGKELFLSCFARLLSRWLAIRGLRTDLVAGSRADRNTYFGIHLKHMASLLLATASASFMQASTMLFPRTRLPTSSLIAASADTEGMGDVCAFLGNHGETGVVCNETVCAEGEIILCTEPAAGLHCELQQNLTIDGKQVWACTTLGDAHQSATTVAHSSAQNASARRTSGTVRMRIEDVSDLGLTMEDLKKPLPEEALETSGYESTSRLPNSNDQGCSWDESADALQAALTIPGLRGQPTMAVAVDLTSETITLTAFGMAVWSCVLRGAIEVDQSSSEVFDGEGALPIVRVALRKRDVGVRWGGMIKSIGEDSLLQ